MSSFAGRLLSYGPSLYWPLDATYGATDQSGNGRNGTGNGGISIGGFAGAPTIAGDSSTSTAFTKASSQYISSTYSGPFTNSAIRTVTGWIYYNALDLTKQAFFGSGSGGFGFLTVVNNSGNAFTEFSPDNSHFTGAAGTLGNLTVATWMHWVFVFDEPGDTATLYVNGTATSRAMASPWATGLADFRVGATGAFFYLDGKMKHIACFEGALSASQVSTLYAARNGEKSLALPHPHRNRPNLRR